MSSSFYYVYPGHQDGIFDASLFQFRLHYVEDEAFSTILGPMIDDSCFVWTARTMVPSHNTTTGMPLRISVDHCTARVQTNNIQVNDRNRHKIASYKA